MFAKFSARGLCGAKGGFEHASDLLRHLFMAGLRQVNRVQRRFVAGDHRKKNPFRDKQNAVLRGQCPLSPAVGVKKRRERQLKHHNLTVWGGQMFEQCIEVVSELLGAGRAENVVAANFDHHHGG